jgi:hypothetical protein
MALREALHRVVVDEPPEPVPEGRAGERADRAGEDDEQDAGLALRRVVAGERHDQFGGNGRKDVLQEHEQGDAEHPHRFDDRLDPGRHARFPLFCSRLLSRFVRIPGIAWNIEREPAFIAPLLRQGAKGVR